jgi:hypothetical protein
VIAALFQSRDHGVDQAIVLPGLARHGARPQRYNCDRVAIGVAGAIGTISL